MVEMKDKWKMNVVKVVMVKMVKIDFGNTILLTKV